MAKKKSQLATLAVAIKDVHLKRMVRDLEDFEDNTDFLVDWINNQIDNALEDGSLKEEYDLDRQHR